LCIDLTVHLVPLTLNLRHASSTRSYAFCEILAIQPEM
jgi:hypothetical protein